MSPLLDSPEIAHALDAELVVDNFAGGGGASLGIYNALGRSPDFAINHDDEALAMHAANHPQTEHLPEDVWNIDPHALVDGRPVALAWFSPDCKHFSRAKGGKPREKRIRSLAWVAVKWAREVRPRVIMLENVREFMDWGPLDDEGMPNPEKKGITFRRFVGYLRGQGYDVDWQVLDAARYGAPTHRKRLFLIARCDGEPIVWPAETHGKRKGDLFNPDRLPYRTAAECIEWDQPCPSIFERSRPLAEKTMARIARGIKRFVLEAKEPFIVPMQHGNRSVPVDAPLQTITTQSNKFNLVIPSLVQTGYGEREGQAPRAINIEKPLGTVVAGGAKHALVAAFLAKHFSGVTGHGVKRPFSTVTAIDHHALVAAHLTKFYGTSTGSDPREPLPVVTGGGQHIGEVRAFLTKYYGTGDGAKLDAPSPTCTTKDRMGLVTVHGIDYQIVDIGMRMLNPRELARAQGFPDDYVLTGTKTSQVARIGNSVCPPVVEALVRANLLEGDA